MRKDIFIQSLPMQRVLGSPFASPPLDCGSFYSASTLDIAPELVCIDLPRKELFPPIDRYCCREPSLSTHVWPSLLPISDEASVTTSSQSQLSFEIDEKGHASVEVRPVYIPETALSSSTSWDDSYEEVLSGKILELSSSPVKSSVEPKQLEIRPARRTTKKETGKACKRPKAESDQGTKPARKKRHIDVEDAAEGAHGVFAPECEPNKVDSAAFIVDRSPQPNAEVEAIVERAASKAQSERLMAAGRIAEQNTPGFGQIRVVIPLERSGKFDFEGSNSRVEALNKLDLPKDQRSTSCAEHPTRLRFPTYVQFAQHLDSEHDSMCRPFLCPFTDCAWSILGFSTIGRAHSHILHGHHEDVLWCELCSKRASDTIGYAQPDDLRKHLLKRHFLKGTSQDPC